MAISGKYLPFQSVIEDVYREVGYQTIDWTQAVEVVGETIGLLGILPSYVDITTNGINGSPVPLEVTDYRTELPNNLIQLKSVRRVILDEIPKDGDTDLKISKFIPMVEATDTFYQSIRDMWNTHIPSGSYNYVAYTQVNTITLSGDSGTMLISKTGNMDNTVIFDTDLETTAESFVTNYAADYLNENIILTSEGNNIIFTSKVSGTKFSSPVIIPQTGNLNGKMEISYIPEEAIVYSNPLRINYEAQYEYKVNDGYIYTNFEDGQGFLEIVYIAFKTDENGFPMIPDDPKIRNAIKWSLIRHIDYKKWRIGEISDKVFQYSDQQRDWYISSAKSNANIPSLDKMESLKNMLLRSIPKVTAHSAGFKYINVPEQRYNHNSKYYRFGF